MEQIVIGNKGQIGSAIQKILGCDGWDIKDKKGIYKNYEIVHVCIPYFDGFVAEINDLQEALHAKIVVVHSTVPVCTTECIKNGVYSPVRGVHPNLEQGIRTFTKYFAGNHASKAARIFNDKIIECIAFNDLKAIRSLEAAKLWDTTQYGWNIILEKLVYKYCMEHTLNYDLVYRQFNASYNNGYEKLGMPQFKKYVLKHMEGKIGGHCVVPNLEFLDSPIADILKDFDIA